MHSEMAKVDTMDGLILNVTKQWKSDNIQEGTTTRTMVICL